jgi:hypothetical protein
MTRRPVAFLVGSPLSFKDGIGVPGITPMLDFVRAEIRDRAAIALPQFEAALNGKVGADAYQAAMKWLGVNAGQDAVNEVIAKAVLQARKTGTVQLPAGVDGEPDDWNIPAGTTGLAELVTRGGDKFLGPILTTNFDPLVSLAVRKSGGRAGRRVLTADGTLAGAAEDEPGISNVVHFHGFWRDSETLHTQAQLTNRRPKLKASLQRLLVAQQRTLIVAAYGGWDDVFTESLVELMNDEQAKLDVIWCFYESDPDKVEQKYGKLLGAVRPAIVLNRFRAFGGIDCHSIFTEILTTLRGMSSPAAVAPVVSSPLAGWEQIGAPYLDSLPALNQEELIRYFDGAVPSWRHAVSPAIPRRRDVATVGNRLATFQPGTGGCSMQLIRAAGGEGKTTLLLQAASDAVRSGNWSVLWRPSPHTRLLPEHVIKLDPARQWLIVADDAENLVDDLKESARQLRAADSSNVHFLLAARDADWWASFGDQPEWETWLKAWVRRQQAIVLRGINPDDARLVVEAWAKCGADGLRQLASLSDATAQVNALVGEVQDAVDEQVTQERKHNPVEGSFFGGLLAVRFGQNGLQAHVRAFLNRLKDNPIEDSDRTLFDALVYVAACHGTGIPGIDERVLADLVGVPREWVQSRVVRPLGEEAAAVQSAGHVFTRHSKVAAAILVEAEQTLGTDLAEIWAQLVRQTVHAGREMRIDKYWFSDVLHAGPRLQHALPKQISEDRRKAIAIAAAKSDVAARSNRLCALTDLARTFRKADMIEQAVATFRENLKSAKEKVDFDSDIRGYWYEWGVCEAERGTDMAHALADAWLAGLAISDHLNPAPITPDNGKLTCAGLGVAFGKLAQRSPDCPFAKARRAITFLGRRCGYDPKSHFFDRYDREADKLKTPHPRDVTEAIAWLTAGVAQAGHGLQDPFLKALLKPEQVSFHMLRDFLDSAVSPRPRTNRYTPSPAPKPAPADDTTPVQLSSKLPVQIQAGIERVITEAWEAAASAAPEDRLRIAKQEAIRIIAGLSPSIRKQVSHHFTSEKWQPLISRDPLTAPHANDSPLAVPAS